MSDGLPNTIRLWIEGRNSTLESLQSLPRIEEKLISATLHGQCVLSYAASKGNESAVRVLLQLGVQVDGFSDFSSPLLEAISHSSPRQLAIVQLLINSGANVKAKVNTSAVFQAVAYDRLSILKELLLQPGIALDEPSPVDETPLMAAAKTGNLEAAKLLLARGANLHYISRPHGNSAAILAAQHQNFSLVALFIAHGACVTHTNSWSESVLTCLLQSSSNRNNERNQVLLQVLEHYLSDRNTMCTVFLWAAEHGHADILSFLLAHDVDIHCQAPSTCATALILAAQQNHTSILALLVQSPHLRTDHIDRFGRSALHYAIQQRNLHAISLLLPCSAESLLLKDGRSGRIPLLTAIVQGDFHLARLLLTYHADRQCQYVNRWGDTPLLSAVQLGALEIVQLLLASQAELKIDHRNESSRTALMEASIRGQPEIVHELLAAGADPFLVDSCGKSARDYAQIAIIRDLLSARMCEDDRKSRKEEEEKKKSENEEEEENCQTTNDGPNRRPDSCNSSGCITF